MSPQISLPKVSHQEALETISRNRLALLFDPAIFELRPESQRDKGIDIIGEIKQDGVYTNFRFAIQLKSTKSVKKLRDGSIPHPVEISNLNYLLNFSLPSFYILYDHSFVQFYIASVGDVYRELLKKYPPEKLPKTYKVKFTRLLNREQIDGIYRETFESGMLLKKLSAHMKILPENDQFPQGFVIDAEQEVYSVDHNIRFIEHAGYDLLNLHDFSRIIDIEKRSHPRGKASPMFNMICGAAYYHHGNLLKAVDLLKLADAEVENLRPEDGVMLLYILTHAKYLLGLLSEPDFRSEMAKIVSNENGGTFLQLEKFHNEFIKANHTDPAMSIRTYYEKTMKVVDTHPELHDIRVVAYAKILNVEAKLLLHELAKNSIGTMGRKADAYRDLVFEDWLKFDKQFLGQLDELYAFALTQQNFLAVSNLMMERIEWEFTKIFHFHAFANWNRKTLAINRIVSPGDVELLLGLVVELDKIIQNYDRLSHRENQFSCLRCKYEILDFLGRRQEADQCSKTMKGLIDTYEMNALSQRFTKMLQGGTMHRIFMADLTERRANIERVAKNSGIYEHLYDDVSKEMIEVSGRRPKWSLTGLFPLIYPSKKC